MFSILRPFCAAPMVNHFIFPSFLSIRFYFFLEKADSSFTSQSTPKFFEYSFSNSITNGHHIINFRKIFFTYIKPIITIISVKFLIIKMKRLIFMCIKENFCFLIFLQALYLKVEQVYHLI